MAKDEPKKSGKEKPPEKTLSDRTPRSCNAFLLTNKRISKFDMVAERWLTTAPTGYPLQAIPLSGQQAVHARNTT